MNPKTPEQLPEQLPEQPIELRPARMAPNGVLMANRLVTLDIGYGVVTAIQEGHYVLGPVVGLGVSVVAAVPFAPGRLRRPNFINREDEGAVRIARKRAGYVASAEPLDEAAEVNVRAEEVYALRPAPLMAAIKQEREERWAAIRARQARKQARAEELARIAASRPKPAAQVVATSEVLPPNYKGGRADRLAAYNAEQERLAAERAEAARQDNERLAREADAARRAARFLQSQQQVARGNKKPRTT